MGEKDVMVRDAGMVLTSAFLPALFQRAGLLEEGGERFVSSEAQSRAVRLLEYTASGALEAQVEHGVCKVLCGMPVGSPVGETAALSDEERALADSVLTAMIANWRIAAEISIAALRETFLEREGRVVEGADRTSLRVQRKTVDVLVDRFPWSFSLVLHRWMTRPLHVQW